MITSEKNKLHQAAITAIIAIIHLSKNLASDLIVALHYETWPNSLLLYRIATCCEGVRRLPDVLCIGPQHQPPGGALWMI
jgi:hypothetical protein